MINVMIHCREFLNLLESKNSIINTCEVITKMKIIQILVVIVVSLIPVSAFSQQVGTSDFVYVSELASDGFQPFPISGVANASFGMMKNTDMYMCFIADTPENQKKRRTILIESFQDDEKSKEIPNIAIVCARIQ